MSQGAWYVGRSRPQRRPASSKKGASDSLRLEAGEELRSQEIPWAWAGHDQRCHVGTLRSGLRFCCRMTLSAQDRHREIIIVRCGADSIDSRASLSIEFYR